MRNLEANIAEWRSRMAAGGIKTPAVLDELESHLREEIQERLAAGDSEKEAFEVAVVRIGNAKSVRVEFDKIRGTTRLPVMIGVAAWSVLIVSMVAFMVWQMAVGKIGILLGWHIFVITAGFLAAFVVGSLGVCSLCGRWFGKMFSDRNDSLHRAAWAFTWIALALMVVGYLLGAVWTSKYRGYYWSGSAREIGAVGTILWLALLVAVQQLKRFNEHFLVAMCAATNVVAAVGWFGAGILSVDRGLDHLGNYWPLEIFLIAHLLFLTLSLRRGLKPAAS
jgi:hypothetical protein